MGWSFFLSEASQEGGIKGGGGTAARGGKLGRAGGLRGRVSKEREGRFEEEEEEEKKWFFEKIFLFSFVDSSSSTPCNSSKVA